jgi:hypothetical protein
MVRIENWGVDVLRRRMWDGEASRTLKMSFQAARAMRPKGPSAKTRLRECCMQLAIACRLPDLRVRRDGLLPSSAAFALHCDLHSAFRTPRLPPRPNKAFNVLAPAKTPSKNEQKTNKKRLAGWPSPGSLRPLKTTLNTSIPALPAITTLPKNHGIENAAHDIRWHSKISPRVVQLSGNLIGRFCSQNRFIGVCSRMIRPTDRILPPKSMGSADADKFREWAGLLPSLNTTRNYK